MTVQFHGGGRRRRLWHGFAMVENTREGAYFTVHAKGRPWLRPPADAYHRHRCRGEYPALLPHGLALLGPCPVLSVCHQHEREVPAACLFPSLVVLIGSGFLRSGVLFAPVSRTRSLQNMRGGMKKQKLDKEKDRDISEKIALGMHKGGGGKGGADL